MINLIDGDFSAFAFLKVSKRIDSGQMKIVNYANVAICIVKYSFNYLLILINWNLSSQLMYTIECLFYTIFGVLMLEKRGLCVDKTNVMFKSAQFYWHVIATFWHITGINPLFKWSQDKQLHQIERYFYFQFLKANIQSALHVRAFILFLSFPSFSGGEKKQTKGLTQ